MSHNHLINTEASFSNDWNRLYSVSMCVCGCVGVMDCLSLSVEVIFILSLSDWHQSPASLQPPLWTRCLWIWGLSIHASCSSARHKGRRRPFSINVAPVHVQKHSSHVITQKAWHLMPVSLTRSCSQNKEWNSIRSVDLRQLWPFSIYSIHL